MLLEESRTINVQLHQPFKPQDIGQDQQRRDEGHRDRSGRFTPGHPGGPGRPRRAVEAEYLRVLLAGCSLGRWAEIVDRAVRDAAAGDPKARDWVGQYVLGNAACQSPTPFDLAVEDEAGADAVANAAILRRAQGLF